MKDRTKYFLIIASVIIYYFIILLVYDFNYIDYTNNTQQFIDDGNVKLNVQDQVSVSVQRNRFYGTIMESNKNSYVDLLGFIKLPLRKDNINFIYFHVVFLTIIAILIYHVKQSKRRSV